MVSDLTERLRTYAADEPEWTSGHKVMTEAADEIERLTAALAEAEKDRDYWKIEAEGERAKVEFRDKKLAQYETLHAVAGFARALKEKP